MDVCLHSISTQHSENALWYLLVSTEQEVGCALLPARSLWRRELPLRLPRISHDSSGIQSVAHSLYQQRYHGSHTNKLQARFNTVLCVKHIAVPVSCCRISSVRPSTDNTPTFSRWCPWHMCCLVPGTIDVTAICAVTKNWPPCDSCTPRRSLLDVGGGEMRAAESKGWQNKYVNPSRSHVQSNSTALAAVPGTTSSSNRRSILQYLTLVFPKLQLSNGAV